jgi:hypothetical protein
MTNEAENKGPSSTFTPEDAYRQLQAAHEGYFQDLQKVWIGVQHRFQKLHTDHAQAAEQAWVNRDKEAFEAELEKHRNEYEAAVGESNPTKDYAEAYSRYKAATLKAMTAVSDPTMLQQVGQSLYIVSSWAQVLNCAAPAVDAKNPG